MIIFLCVMAGFFIGCLAAAGFVAWVLSDPIGPRF